jgi:hypothetical protein
MKKVRLSILVIYILAVSISCNKEETPPEVPQEVINESLSLFDGDVIEKNQEMEDGQTCWKVKIENPEGALVSFYWSTTINNDLTKILGSKGPFEYDLNPGMSLINLSTAKTFAIAAVKNDSILNWELERNEDFINNWVYEFEFETGSDTLKVYIDAMNGDVLQID